MANVLSQLDHVSNVTRHWKNRSGLANRKKNGIVHLQIKIFQFIAYYHFIYVVSTVLFLLASIARLAKPGKTAANT